ncbi:MAG: type VI secretion system protein VasD [Glaciecola sp.]|jgi:type VI secretion system protein VasD
MLSRLNNNTISSQLLAIGFLAIMLGGCGATSMVEDVFSTITKADLTIEAAQNVNPDIDGRPSPVLLRFFELKSTAAFNNADFFNLYDQGVGELGADYVGHFDVEMKPGESKEILKEFLPDTRYLGVMAAYRDINNAVWRRIIDIEVDSNSDLLITLNSNEINIVRQ